MKMTRWGAYLALVVGALWMAGPFILMLLTSFMTYNQTVAYPPRWWPDPWTLDNHVKALTQTPLLRYFANSVLVAACVVVGQVVTGALAGYAFARLSFKGRQVLFWAVLATMMVPVYILLVPLFVLMAWLGWVDSYQALIVPGLTGAFGIFLFRQWFLSFPKELEESARIDGCTPWSVFWRVALPTALPAVATLAIFEFLASWNTFQWPLIVTHSDQLRTLPVGLAAFRSTMKEVTDWGLLLAATTAAVLPAIAVFAVGQKYLVKGLLDGSVKG